MTIFRSLLPVVLMLFAAASTRAPAQDRPRITTNESYVEEAARKSELAVEDRLAVFAFVFESLPERVKVYPTENYYYFTFLHNGAPYNGNIRLDASDRDQGKLHFGYAEDLAEWRDDTPVHYVLLQSSHGVTVERLERFLYRVTFKGKSVVFALNDLSHVRPPATALAPGETFIGPIFDESAIRFYLVYNPRLKIFHYILDESAGVADAFVPARRSDRILIGKRTGFAFYRDHLRDRKILIGVYEGNSRLNNYFDGPFDQLPDNFIDGETLRNAILDIEPRLKGRIDRFGGSPDGAIRYLIEPYSQYDEESDLLGAHRCAIARLRGPAYYTCFVAQEGRSAFGPRRGGVGKSGKTTRPAK